MLWYEVYNTCLNTVEAAASVVRALSSTAGETFEMTVSSELSKARSRFGDVPACETSAGASLAVLGGCRLCRRGRGCQKTGNNAVFHPQMTF
jgi:hypothetical protein